MDQGTGSGLVSGMTTKAASALEKVTEGLVKATNHIFASLALIPKISPSIKPLLPGGSSMHDDPTAFLLPVSKSNYQNIIEGPVATILLTSTNIGSETLLLIQEEHIRLLPGPTQ
ncbi:hypothetical protein NHQ30_002438 [Ciborinia camelliae]|nr:hypothetical protein NHQ30_002438 [Ciborinia camelliae]